jgi:hypothetical protein
MDIQWLELTPLNLSGPEAAVINRRIATHLQFRRQIDSNDPAVTLMKTWITVDGNRVPSETDTMEKAITEALRRELFIRRDTVTLLKQSELPTEDAQQAYNQVREQLRTRERPTVLSSHNDLRRVNPAR